MELPNPDMTVAAGQNPDLQVRTGFVMQPGPDAGGEIAPREIAAKLIGTAFRAAFAHKTVEFSMERYYAVQDST